MDNNLVILFNEYKERLKENVSASGKTSMSVRLDGGFAFAAYSAEYGSLSEQDIVTLKYGEECGADALLHKSLYLSDQEIRAVIHSDTPYAAAIGKTGLTLSAILDDTAQIIGISVRTAENEAEKILKALKDRKGAIIKDNGTITHGRTLDEAYTGCLVLEKAAKCYIAATILGNYKKIPYIEAVLMHFIYQKKYSKANQSRLQAKTAGEKISEKNVAVFDEKESKLRQQIIDAGIRMLNSNLVQGTWGNISVRLDETHMLITPSGLDYLSLNPEDIVKVNFETMEYEGDLKPSGEKDIHAMLLKTRKDIDVVMHSHPNESSAFAAAGIELPAETPEMTKHIKGSARVSKYALPSTKSLAKATVAAMEGRNACFMANHGMLAVGKSFDDAFECCQILENNAGAFIDSKASEYCPDCKTSEDKRIKAFYKIKK